VAPFTASGLSQWGPPITKDFLGIALARESFRELRSGDQRAAQRQRIDVTSLRGLLSVANS